MSKIADFCLSSCLEEKQNQAIASKQFGSMRSIETGMDSSSVVQVSSLMACSTNLIFFRASTLLHFHLCCSELADGDKRWIVEQKWVPVGGREVYLRDFGKPSVHRYSG